jgi:hypothetical protein
VRVIWLDRPDICMSSSSIADIFEYVLACIDERYPTRMCGGCAVIDAGSIESVFSVSFRF